MKLNDAYLCVQTGCDEVFSMPKRTTDIYEHIHYPICPICGSKNAINLGRILNRSEAIENEDPIKRIPGVGSIDTRRYGVNYAVKSHHTGEVFKTLRSNSSKDDLLRVPKVASNICSVCSPENKSGA